MVVSGRYPACLTNSKTEEKLRGKLPEKIRLHRIMSGILLVIVAAMIVLCAGCTDEREDAASASPGAPENSVDTEVTYTGTNVEKIELYHFHGDRSCTSCTVLGDFAEDTLTEWYAPELESGRIVFDHVNFDNPDNTDLVERYGPTGSSLWIGVYDANGFYAQELVAPWYMIKDKEQFSTYIRAVIEQQLGQIG